MSYIKHGKVGSLRTFGIELEVTQTQNQVSHGTTFTYKRDGSVNGQGLEFVSPILQGDAGLATVQNLCAYAKANEWRIDDSCGYHLHIGVRDLTPEQRKAIVYAYSLTTKLWLAMANPTRTEGRYCKELAFTSEFAKINTFDRIVGASGDRYRWLNLASYCEHGTIEIRLHEGTLDVKVITNWIKAHLRFVEKMSKLTIAEIDAMFNGKGTQAAYRAIELVWADRDVSEHFRRIMKNFDAPVHAMS